MWALNVEKHIAVGNYFLIIHVCDSNEELLFRQILYFHLNSALPKASPEQGA